MRLMLDFDSVICKLESAFITSVNERFGTAYTLADATNWSWWSEQGDDIRNFVWGDECYNNFDWTIRLEPMPDAIESIKKLQSIGYDMLVCTDRVSEMRPWVMQWLKNYDLSLPVVTTAKQFTKAEFAIRYGYDIAIDDAPHNAVDFAKLDIPVLLYDHPWNRDVVMTTLIYRVFSWADITDILQRVLEHDLHYRSIYPTTRSDAQRRPQNISLPNVSREA